MYSRFGRLSWQVPCVPHPFSRYMRKTQGHVIRPNPTPQRELALDHTAPVASVRRAAVATPTVRTSPLAAVGAPVL